MKNKFKGLGVFGVFLGMWLSRNFGNNNYFGLDGRVTIGLICLLIIVPSIIILFFKKFYLVSFLVTILVTPMVVAFVGIYYDNMNLVLCGLIVFFVILLIYLILIKRHNKNKDTINYDKYWK